MDKKIKILLIIQIIAIVVLSFILVDKLNTGISYGKVEIQENYLADYSELENRARLAVNVYSVVNNETYSRVRQELEPYTTTNFKQVHFPTGDWNLEDRNPALVAVENVEISVDQEKYALVYYRITAQGFVNNQISLVRFTNDNMIDSIERL